jgi:hypothetical protein
MEITLKFRCFFVLETMEFMLQSLAKINTLVYFFRHLPNKQSTIILHHFGHEVVERRDLPLSG